MRKRQISYLCIFACVLVLNFIFSDYLPFMLLIVMILIPMAMLLFGVVVKANVEVHLKAEEKTAIRGQKVTYALRIKNNFMLSVDELNVYVAQQYSNLEQAYISIHTISLDSLKICDLKDTYRIAHGGNHELYVEKLTFHDPLGLFLFSMKGTERMQLEAMPVLTEPDYYMLYSTEDSFCEAFEFSQNKGGDDSSEIFDVRKYHGGDALNRVHWKLSAREDELLVKEFSLPISKSNCIVLELHFCNDSEARKKLDGIYEMAYAICNYACLKEKMIQFQYYEETHLAETLIESIKDCEEVMLQLLHTKTSEKNPAFTEAVLYGDADFEKLFYITDRLDDEVMEFLNTPHDFTFNCFCIGDDQIIGESDVFEGGKLVMVNRSEIRQGLSAVVL